MEKQIELTPGSRSLRGVKPPEKTIDRITGDSAAETVNDHAVDSDDRAGCVCQRAARVSGSQPDIREEPSRLANGVVDDSRGDGAAVTVGVSRGKHNVSCAKPTCGSYARTDWRTHGNGKSGEIFVGIARDKPAGDPQSI